MSRAGVDVAALAERVSALEVAVTQADARAELAYRVGDSAEAGCGALAADVAAVREAVRRLAFGIRGYGVGHASPTMRSAADDAFAALDAPAPDPAPPLADRSRYGTPEPTPYADRYVCQKCGEWAVHTRCDECRALPPALDAEKDKGDVL